MTDLSTLVEPLKREVAVPGTYATAFPSTDDAALIGTLADSFGLAQLDGFFGPMSLDIDTLETTPDLSLAGEALLVLYAGIRILRSQIRTISQSATYKAGPVEYSTSSMTTVLRDEMKAMRERLDGLITQGRRSGRSIRVADSYATRVIEGKLSAYVGPFGSFYDYEF